MSTNVGPTTCFVCDAAIKQPYKGRRRLTCSTKCRRKKLIIDQVMRENGRMQTPNPNHRQP